MELGRFIETMNVLTYQAHTWYIAASESHIFLQINDQSFKHLITVLSSLFLFWFKKEP